MSFNKSRAPAVEVRFIDFEKAMILSKSCGPAICSEVVVKEACPEAFVLDAVMLVIR